MYAEDSFLFQQFLLFSSAIASTYTKNLVSGDVQPLLTSILGHRGVPYQSPSGVFS